MKIGKYEKMGATFLVIMAVFTGVNVVKGDYVAAVLEYSPVNLTTPNETISKNLNEYLHHIENAAINKVDIIVFPEYGLTGLIDDPTNYSIEIPSVGTGPPFNNNVLETLSNAAEANDMYIVFNIAEKSNNTNNETIYYNTNVVFGIDRKIIAKYRKINLFEEFLFTPGDVEENKHVTFTTDFGVTFGVFICFDIAFYTPSRTVLNNSVTDIVYPTAWYSQLPFYHSLSFHYGYAMENRVNVLSANINNVKEGQGGSGIYGADGTIYSYYLSGASDVNQLLISTVKHTHFGLRSVPVNSTTYGFDIIEGGSKNDLSNYNISRYFTSNYYTFKNVDVSKPVNVSEQICSGGFCCDFTLNVTSNSSKAIHKLMAYSGPSLLSPSLEGYIKVCALLACETEDHSSCATKNVKETAQFGNITVTSRNQQIIEEYLTPITLTTDLLPVFNTTYISLVGDGTRNVTLNTGKPENSVLVFGIYGNGAVQCSISTAILLIVMVFKFVF